MPEDEGGTGEISQPYTASDDDAECAAPSVGVNTTDDKELKSHLPEESVYI